VGFNICVATKSHVSKFNVVLTLLRGVTVLYEPTGCTIYFQFISIINLCMFRAGLLLIIRRYYSVFTNIYTAIDIYTLMLAFIIRIYHDARSSECQIPIVVYTEYYGRYYSVFTNIYIYIYIYTAFSRKTSPLCC